MPCALCLADKPLRNSHIIPEFLYRALYDDKHRFHALTTRADTKDRLEQKGARQRLLCAECEQRLSVHERYASQLFNGGAGFGCKRNGNLLSLSGIDYRQFKLFQLSILWRASVSTLRFFKNVDLGLHEERIRRMLLEAQPGAYNHYPCLMWGLQLEPSQPVGLMMEPGKQPRDGFTHYLFVFGGFLWDFRVSCRPLSETMGHVVLRESGTMMIQVRPVTELSGLRTFMTAHAKRAH